MSHTIPYPILSWDRWSPSAAGFDPQKIVAAKQWLEERAKPDKKPYRIAIARGGRLVVEWDISFRGALLLA
jgi:hypothetical protein